MFSHSDRLLVGTPVNKHRKLVHAQIHMKLSLLMNVKMSSVVGVCILIFMSGRFFGLSSRCAQGKLFP